MLDLGEMVTNRNNKLKTKAVQFQEFKSGSKVVKPRRMYIGFSYSNLKPSWSHRGRRL
jgi:hypothetical protein